MDEFVRLSKRAHLLGLAVAVKQGKAQLQRITYRPNGTAMIERLSGFLPPAQLHALVDAEIARR